MRNELQPLSRRERLIMDVLYRLGQASAADVRAALPDDPSDSTVRTQLRGLESKGHVVHVIDGMRYVYAPRVPRTVARRSVLRHVVDTFFDGSEAQLLTSLLGQDGRRLTPDELDRIEELIRRARGGES